MNRREYFIKAVQAGAYCYKRWAIECFSITDDSTDIGLYPFALLKDKEHGYGFIDPLTNGVEFIEGAKKNEPLFRFSESLTAYKNELPNLNEAVETTYGQFFINAYVLCHAFSHRIPYMTGEISAKRLEKEVLKRYEVDSETKDPEAIYTDMYLKFAQACSALEGLAPICVVSATPKTITCDPRIAKRRKELLKQYEGQLDDPIIQTRIEEELLAIDREWMKGDPGERFYLKSKSYNVIRKKMYIMQGSSDQLGGDAVYIPDPLHDGWKEDNLPAMINSMRSGSYSRGASTAKGGEITKYLSRIFQNSSIVEDDCGSHVGMEIVLTSDNALQFLGHSIITGPQSLVELKKDNLSQYIGKKVQLRYPIYCQSKGANFCSTCMGKSLIQTPDALSTYAATVGSTMLSLSLKSMHGTSQETMKFRIDDILC